MRWFISITRSLEIIDDVHALSESYLGRQMKGRYVGYWEGGNVSHARDHCGNSSNQVIYDRDNNGVGEAMVETGTDGLGTLECTIYTDCNSYTGEFTGLTSASQVHIGQEIYWTTSSGSRTWHHKGTVTATAEGHPNRS